MRKFYVRFGKRDRYTDFGDFFEFAQTVQVKIVGALRPVAFRDGYPKPEHGLRRRPDEGTADEFKAERAQLAGCARVNRLV